MSDRIVREESARVSNQQERRALAERFGIRVVGMPIQRPQPSGRPPVVTVGDGKTTLLALDENARKLFNLTEPR